MLLNSIFSTFKTMTRLFHLLPTTMPVAKPNDAFALFERHQPAIFHRDATAAAAAFVPLLPLQSGELNVFERFRQCLCTRVCVGKFMRNCNQTMSKEIPYFMKIIVKLIIFMNFCDYKICLWGAWCRLCACNLTLAKRLIYYTLGIECAIERFVTMFSAMRLSLGVFNIQSALQSHNIYGNSVLSHFFNIHSMHGS